MSGRLRTPMPGSTSRAWCPLRAASRGDHQLGRGHLPSAGRQFGLRLIQSVLPRVVSATGAPLAVAAAGASPLAKKSTRNRGRRHPLREA